MTDYYASVVSKKSWCDANRVRHVIEIEQESSDPKQELIPGILQSDFSQIEFFFTNCCLSRKDFINKSAGPPIS